MTETTMTRLVAGLNRIIPGRRAQRVGRRSSTDGYRVYLMHTRTGQVGPMLDPSAGSWTIPLNGTEDMAVTVQKPDLAGIERRWYTPWWGGLLFTITRGGVEIPLVAGPITGWPGETDDNLQLQGRGIRELYKHLLVENPAGLHITNRSLGQIMWQLADHPRTKPGGGLPVFDGTPDPDGRGHDRNYEGYNLSNNDLDKRMQELSEVQNGPDVMFRPRWSDSSHRFIRWAVCHGTSLSPRIRSEITHDFDTTAARSAVATIQVKTDAKALASRAWATGAGEGAGTVIAKAEDLSLVGAGFPFMEAVVSDTSATADDSSTTISTGEAVTAKEKALQAQRLNGLAAGELESRVDGIDQITVTTRVEDTQHGPETVLVGDAAAVTISGWLAVPDGTHQTRVIEASGTLDGDVTYEFQTDTWV